MEARGRPTPRLGDHLRVAWLLLVTLLNVIPVAIWILFSPVLRPTVRAVMRRRLLAAPRIPAEPPVPDPTEWAGRTVFVVAGEASGDRLAARVVLALKSHSPGLTVRGFAGPATAAAGAELDRDIVDRAVVGVVPVIKSLSYWWTLSAQTLALLRDDPPDLFFTVDFPGLNGRLARWARKAGVVAVHLVAPAVWAYAPWRMGRWRTAVDRLLTMFPFETALFHASRIPSLFVGHPLFESPLEAPRTPEDWPGAGPATVELLPGSRRQEIQAHASIVLEAAADIDAARTETNFVVRLADAVHAEVFEMAAGRARRRPREWRIEVGPAESPADPPLLGAVASSGTVTAELGAACIPMTVFYRLTPLARLGAFLGLTAPYFAVVNLIAGRRVVPERLMILGRGRRVGRDFLSFASDAEGWRAMRTALDERVRQRIAVPRVADRAARAVLDAARWRPVSAKTKQQVEE